VQVGVWLAAMRPRTWPASLVPVGVGLAVAASAGHVDPFIAIATILSALALQITTNLANDYWDHARGVDHGERLGPTRATQSGLLTPQAVLRAVYVSLTVATLAGLPLVLRGGVPIVVVGIVSMLGAVAYSAGPCPLASLGLGELLAFVFFGLVAVSGTAYLHLAYVSVSALLAGAAVGAFAAAIMSVNNLRDIPTDAPAGKLTLAVRIGDARARSLYTVLVVAGFVPVVVMAVMLSSSGPLLVVLAAPSALKEIRGVAVRRGAELNVSLAGTARLELLFGALLSAGLIIG
jgi:1,4-dihydroxy-2-naphthoate octaprenyltransferase